jgi:hypothetical protein
MHQFRIRQDGFKAIKKTLLTGFALGAIIAMLLPIILSTVTPHTVSDDSSIFTMILMSVLLAFITYTSINRYRKMLESYRLTITEDAVTREQVNTPTITIRKDAVTKIIKASNGGFAVIGGSKLNAIGIPAQIEQHEDVERILSGIRPLTVQTAQWLQYLQVAAVILVFIPICLGLLSENRIVLSLSGIAMCGLMILGFVIIQRSKNYDRRMKRLSYIMWIPFLAIMANVTLQWLSVD